MDSEQLLLVQFEMHKSEVLRNESRIRWRDGTQK